MKEYFSLFHVKWSSMKHCNSSVEMPGVAWICTSDLLSPSKSYYQNVSCSFMSLKNKISGIIAATVVAFRC